jgi:ALG6, ALG8 glycosyltransferase family
MRKCGREINCRGDYIRPEWFELDTSRGMETQGIKSFMRFSVIISDYVLYVPVLLMYTRFVVPAGRKIDKVFLHKDAR